jgi:hypothetical protein
VEFKISTVTNHSNDDLVEEEPVEASLELPSEMAGICSPQHISDAMAGP